MKEKQKEQEHEKRERERDNKGWKKMGKKRWIQKKK